MNVLYSKRSDGKIQRWHIWVKVHQDNTASIITESGIIDGKQIRDEQHVTKGKNIGRSNETTPVEQAIKTAKSKWQRRYDGGARPRIQDIPEPSLPMLAHSFTKRKKSIKYPAYAQPKLDGVRCIAKKVSTNKIEFMSRGGKEFATLGHLEKSLLPIMKVGEKLDGELYIHGMVFQKIVSLIKKYREGETEDIQYWVYDVPSNPNDFSDRFKYYWKKLKGQHKSIIPVETYKVKDEVEFLERHSQWVKLGYEGSIIRNAKGKYAFGKRSSNLQKYKDFIDDEFEIVSGWTPANGREHGAIMWTCTTDGVLFNVRPRGEMKLRQELWEEYKADPQNFIGKQLIVRYQNLSLDNIPIFPVGITIRDYE